ncbi:MAG: energy transducer TonB [Sulfuricella sp.]|nr:energy transducer TonB [Sulfuricella sp.]
MTANTHTQTYANGPPISLAGLLGIVGLHIAAAAALLSTDGARRLPQTPALMVRLIQPSPTPPTTRQPAKPPAQPRRHEPVPEPRPPVQTTSSAAPAEAVEMPVAKAAPSAPELSAARPMRPSAAEHPAPAVTEPSFNADYLLNPAPVYPAMSRRLGESGKTLLRVFVEPDGRPSQIEIKAGSGFARLDQAAADAVRRWKFVPARHGDDAIGMWVLVPIVFNLRG